MSPCVITRSVTIARLETEQGELPGREVLRADRNEAPEPVEPVTAAGGFRVVGVRRREAGVDEDDAVVGGDDVTENRDPALRSSATSNVP